MTLKIKKKLKMENKIDKSKMLQSHIILVNDAVNFKGTVEGNPSISIDYTPPLGNNLGYTSLELFLLSLSSHNKSYNSCNSH